MLRLCGAVLKTFCKANVFQERQSTTGPEHPCTFLVRVFKAELICLLILSCLCRAWWPQCDYHLISCFPGEEHWFVYSLLKKSQALDPGFLSCDAIHCIGSIHPSLLHSLWDLGTGQLAKLCWYSCCLLYCIKLSCSPRWVSLSTFCICEVVSGPLAILHECGLLPQQHPWLKSHLFGEVLCLAGMTCLNISATLCHWLRADHGKFGFGEDAMIVENKAVLYFRSSVAAAVSHSYSLQLENWEAQIHPALCPSWNSQPATGFRSSLITVMFTCSFRGFASQKAVGIHWWANSQWLQSSTATVNEEFVKNTL